MDSTLNVTPEGSLNDILTTSREDVGLMETQQSLRISEQGMIGNYPSAAALDGVAETPYTSVKVLLGRSSDEQPPRMTRLIDVPQEFSALEKPAKRMH